MGDEGSRPAQGGAGSGAGPGREPERAGRLHWGRRPERPAPGAAPGPAPGSATERPAYRVGTSRDAVVATAERLAASRGQRERAASFDRSVQRAVAVVARQAEGVSAGAVHVTRVVAEKRWIDPEQPFLMVSVTVTPPGASGWSSDDLESVRARVREMALAVPGGPREVVVFIDQAASGAASSRARRARRPGDARTRP